MVIRTSKWEKVSVSTHLYKTSKILSLGSKPTEDGIRKRKFFEQETTSQFFGCNNNNTSEKHGHKSWWGIDFALAHICKTWRLRVMLKSFASRGCVTCQIQLRFNEKSFQLRHMSSSDFKKFFLLVVAPCTCCVPIRSWLLMRFRFNQGCAFVTVAWQPIVVVDDVTTHKMIVHMAIIIDDQLLLVVVWVIFCRWLGNNRVALVPINQVFLLFCFNFLAQKDADLFLLTCNIRDHANFGLWPLACSFCYRVNSVFFGCEITSFFGISSRK